MTQETEQTTFNLLPDEEVFDECFVVRETRYGLFITYILPEGTPYLTGGTREGVVFMTRTKLKWIQEGTLKEHTRVVETSTYKL